MPGAFGCHRHIVWSTDFPIHLNLSWLFNYFQYFDYLVLFQLTWQLANETLFIARRNFVNYFSPNFEDCSRYEQVFRLRNNCNNRSYFTLLQLKPSLQDCGILDYKFMFSIETSGAISHRSFLALIGCQLSNPVKRLKLEPY